MLSTPLISSLLILVGAILFFWQGSNLPIRRSPRRLAGIPLLLLMTTLGVTGCAQRVSPILQVVQPASDTAVFHPTAAAQGAPTAYPTMKPTTTTRNVDQESSSQQRAAMHTLVCSLNTPDEYRVSTSVAKGDPGILALLGANCDTPSTPPLTGAPFPIGPGEPMGPPQVPQECLGRAPPSDTICFAIVDKLGEGQIKERVRVTINGVQVGVIVIDELNSGAVMYVVAPRATSYRYNLHIQTYYEGVNESTPRVRTVNRVLNASHGKTYELVYCPRNSNLIWLNLVPPYSEG
ncbi:MAG: DUF1634 domain-containing protein [Oscillochloris sp.]|nr:DUF1634 domain-containing protein [Oscillochloris sp.]